MLTTTNEISNLLKNTFLDQRKIITLATSDCDITALAIQINREEIFQAWQLLHSYLSTTQRWPIIAATWNWDGQQRDWATDVLNADFLSRQPFQFDDQQHQQLNHYLPNNIIARSHTVDLNEFLEQAAKEQQKSDTIQTLKEDIEYEVKKIPEQFDPAAVYSQLLSLIDSGELQSTLALEKWLLDWEIAHGMKTEPPNEADGYLSWYEPAADQSLALILLPTATCWESVAYLHWYGAEGLGSDRVSAFLKRWHERYGAELVCHYGTMLQLVVQKRPITLQEAFELAWEQTAIAPCTTLLPGIPLRDHARELMGCDRWFLHERP